MVMAKGLRSAHNYHFLLAESPATFIYKYAGMLLWDSHNRKLFSTKIFLHLGILSCS